MEFFCGFSVCLEQQQTPHLNLDNIGIMVMRLDEHLGSDLAHGKGRLVVSSLKWLTSFWHAHYKPSSNLTVTKCQGLPTSCSEVVHLDSKMNNFDMAHSCSTTCFQSTNMICRNLKLCTVDHTDWTSSTLSSRVICPERSCWTKFEGKLLVFKRQTYRVSLVHSLPVFDLRPSYIKHWSAKIVTSGFNS